MSPAAIGHTLTLVPTGGQLVVLALMLGCGIWAARAKTRLAFVALGACLLFWLRANSHLEGMVLISFSAAHGLTLADLLVPLVVAFVVTGQTERRKAGRDRRGEGRVGGRRATDLPLDPDPELDPEPDGTRSPSEGDVSVSGAESAPPAGDLGLPQARTGELDAAVDERPRD